MDEWSRKFQKISSTFNTVKTNLNQKSDRKSKQTKQFSYSDLDTSDQETKPLSQKNYDSIDDLKKYQERQALLSKESTSVEAQIELSKRRAAENSDLSETFKVLNAEQTNYTNGLNNLNDNVFKKYKSQANLISEVTNSLEQDIIESKKAQNAIDSVSEETIKNLGYQKDNSYFSQIRQSKKDFNSMLERIETSSIDSLKPQGDNIKKYYDEIRAEQQSFQRQLNNIDSAPIANLIGAIKQQADGQLSLNLETETYSNISSSQNTIDAQRKLILQEETDGQLAFNLSEKESIDTKQEDIAATSAQVAAKEAVIEASNKELLANVNEKLAKAGVKDVTGELTIERLKAIAAEESEGSAIAKETLQLLGLEGQSKKTSLALKGLAMAGNMIAMLAITKGIELVIKGIDNLANSAKHCNERVENLLSSYKSSLSDANSNAARAEELADDYEKLSKGVNNLGQNVSLTSDEYKQYNSIVNEIAKMFPTLITGFTKEGTAILNLKGNVEGLREAYKEAQKEAYNLLISSGEDSDGNDIITQWRNTHTTDFTSKFITRLPGDNEVKVGRDISATDVRDMFEKILNMSSEEFDNYKKTLSKDEFNFLKQNLGVDVIENTTSEENLAKIKEQAQSYVQTYNAEIESSLSNVETLANAYLNTNDDYSSLDEESQNIASVLVNNLDEDIANGFNSKTDVATYVSKIVSRIKNNPELKNALSDLLKGNFTNLSVDEAKKKIDEDIKTISEALGEEPEKLKKRLNFEDYNGENIDALTKKVQGFLQGKAKNKVGTLSLGDLEIAAKFDIGDGTYLTWEELKKKIQNEKDGLNNNGSTTKKTSFKKAWAGLDDNEDYKNTKKEVLELAEAGKLTPEAFKKADNGNAKKYFESMGIGAEEATKKINATVDAVKQLSSLKSGITSIRDAYTEKKDDGIVGADTLNSMEEEFGNLGKAWENYKKIAGSSKSKLSDLADAEDELARAYLRSNNFLANLTDENGNYDESIRQLYVDQLKSYGIKNAENVVDSEIARQQGDATAAYAALSSQQKENIKSVAELKDKTSDEILELYNEADGSDTAKQALLRLSMVNTNWQDLDTTETCNQLMNIARAAGIATDQILGLNGLKIKSVSDYSTTTSPGLQTNSGLFNTNQNPSSTNNSFQPNNIPGFKQFVINNTYKALNGSTQDYTKPDLKHGSDKNKNKNTKGGGNNSKSSDSKTQFDWIERRITNLQTRFDRWKTIIENSSLKFIDKYYKKATSYAKKLVNTEGSAYTKYMKKANNVTISKNSKTDKSLKAKVRNGKISGKTSDLIKEYGSKTTGKIQKYQDYYEKATSALDSFVEKAQELYNLPLDKASAKIEKFSDAIDLLEKKLDNAITATAKNKIIDDEVKEKKNTYDANKSANNKTQKNLKSAGNKLKKSVGKKQKKSITKAVKNGKEVDLAKFKEGSKAYKAAVKYNAALNAKTKAQQEKDVSEQEYNYYKDIEAPKTKFDNVKDEYENKLTIIDARIQNLDNQIDNIEASGATVDNSFYKEKKKQTDQKKALLIEEKNRLAKSLKDIKKYSAEWYTANDEINKVNDSIAECTKTQYELNDAIAEGNKKIFEKKLEGYQRIIDEQDFLLGLIEHEDSVDSDTGVRTDAGNARLHSYTADYYASDEKVNIATAERQRLESMKAAKEYGVGYEYSSLEALNNAINDIIKTQQENIASKYSIEKKIVDEVTKSYQAQMTVLQKLIDKKKEQLETEKDIFDYQKQISEKTKNIDTLRKQLAAMNGDTSKEAMAQKQKLQVSLNDAVDDLKDTEYDRYISDVSKMLDKLQKEYQEWQEKFLKKFDELLKEGLGIGNSTNGSYLATIAKNNGYNIQNPNANNNGKGGVNNDGSANGNTNPVKLKDDNSFNNNSSKPSSSAPKVNNKITAIGIESEETKAKKYINKNKSKSTKPLGRYSYVNQKIAALTKDKHGTYVLNTSHLKGLAKLLGVKQDGNYKKSGKLAKKLHSIGLKGFSKGGVVSVDSLNKQIRANGDDGLASVKNGEAILTPAQTEMFKQFVENMQGNLPQQNHKMSNNLANLAKVIPNNVDYGGVNFNFELNNVTNGDEFIREIQTNQKMQKALQSVTVDKINGGGRLSVNRIK